MVNHLNIEFINGLLLIDMNNNHLHLYIDIF